VLYQVACLVGQGQQGLAMLQKMQRDMQEIQALSANFLYRPKIYFEEWDVPHISAIRWVSELIGIAGGDDIFPELATQSLGKNRILADGSEIIKRNPDIIIGSWCGKKFRPETVAARAGWDEVAAVKTGQIFEIKSADILQPGPAALTDGVVQLHRIIMNWHQKVASALTTAHARQPDVSGVA
jgi:iron complex transport system substrate-binding protein